MTLEIEKAGNWYIVKTFSEKQVFTNLDNVLAAENAKLRAELGQERLTMRKEIELKTDSGGDDA